MSKTFTNKEIFGAKRLQEYGVKGMKWGARKEKTGSPVERTALAHSLRFERSVQKMHTKISDAPRRLGQIRATNLAARSAANIYNKLKSGPRGVYRRG